VKLGITEKPQEKREGYMEKKRGRLNTLKSRIGERKTRNWEEETGDGKRKSKDKVKNAEGKRLMECIEENGWQVLNGNKQGAKKGNEPILAIAGGKQ
jgi:hypothetical protein